MSKKTGGTNADGSQREAYKTGQVIIIGFTGSLGSGCSFLAEGVKRSVGTDAHLFRLSDCIRESLRSQGIKKPKTEQLQDEGDRLRKEHGLEYLVSQCVAKMDEIEKRGRFNDHSVILIDGIRNTGEVRSLRSSPNFFLVAVHAARETRRRRLVGSGKRFKSDREFDAADTRDFEEEGASWGQQVQLCSDLADVIINNEDRLQENTTKQNDFFQHFVSTYVSAMKALRNGSEIFDRAPTMDETLMTMAFCASARSSCAKRKVGAVVAYVRQFPAVAGHVKRKEDDFRYQVISSGYNEVPLGMPPCLLSEDEQCYRDKLRERVSAHFKNCPACGAKLPAHVCQDFQKLSAYNCAKCGEQVGRCLPGTGEESGRLLDMCRALHAEENAILGLAGVAKSGNGNLVLYTTTFPCNLCANKVVEAGIKLVVYTDPYPMKEAKEILDRGGVEIRKFQGVKSSAYFRIYAS